jgi:2-C-methyl-D-erythritol 2,4-cyclodiphosphate synthase
MQSSLYQMRENIASALEIDLSSIGITCTSGNHMGNFGAGIGVQCFCILSVA